MCETTLYLKYFTPMLLASLLYNDIKTIITFYLKKWFELIFQSNTVRNAHIKVLASVVDWAKTRNRLYQYITIGLS